jgi:hypothetical protein
MAEHIKSNVSTDELENTNVSNVTDFNLESDDNESVYSQSEIPEKDEYMY